MFLTKKHLSRRAVLRGAGVSLALPFLDAMVPASTALAQTAAAGKIRTGFFYIPHGAIMHNTAHGPELDSWTPRGAGDNFELSKILASLEPHKKYVNSFGNLENAASAGSVHTIVPATWLSGVRPDSAAAGASMSTTLDQVIAQQIGQDTALPSLEVAAETTVQVAACGGGTGGCYYSSTLSFRNANSPLPMEFNPRKIFLQLFGEGDNSQERDAIIRQKASILDLIAERTNALQKTLGPSDKLLLDGYLDTVREIERRVNIQANLTRVASYIMVSEGTNRTYNHIGVPDAFHPLSHHANDLERLRRLVRIQTWHVEQFSAFLDKLANTPDGEGSLLDNSLFMYGSNMSNSDMHNNYPVPNILVGGGAGTMKLGGQHVELAERTPIANLHLTMLDKLGIEVDQWANATGIISEV